jgi:hypothetical protein
MANEQTGSIESTFPFVVVNGEGSLVSKHASGEEASHALVRHFLLNHDQEIRILRRSGRHWEVF